MEVADILRAQGDRFLERYQSSFSYQQLKAFWAISSCRTAALGGHIDVCHHCGYEASMSYNSPVEGLCPWRQQRIMTLAATEFLRRFFLHVLPRGFVRIRHFGLLSNRFRSQRLPLARTLLALDPARSIPPTPVTPAVSAPLWHCPKCGGPMCVVRRLTAAELSLLRHIDSS